MLDEFVLNKEMDRYDVGHDGCWPLFADPVAAVKSSYGGGFWGQLANPEVQDAQDQHRHLSLALVNMPRSQPVIQPLPVS